jgi:hypothetical protein
MTRFASSQNAAAAAGVHVPYGLFADFDFPSGHVRLTSCGRSYTFGGNTYEAVGKLASIGDISESGDLLPDGLNFGLSGFDNSILRTVLTEKYHGRSAVLYVGYMDNAGNLVDTPHLLWEGRMDVMASHSEAGGASVNLACESRLVIWNVASGWLYTDEHQRVLGGIADAFLDKVSSIQNRVVKWLT